MPPWGKAHQGITHEIHRNQNRGKEYSAKNELIETSGQSKVDILTWLISGEKNQSSCKLIIAN